MTARPYENSSSTRYSARRPIGSFRWAARLLPVLALLILAAFPFEVLAQQRSRPGNATFSTRELVGSGHRFFGTVSRGLALTIEEATRRWGEPNGYILGQEAS
ncbi:MAG TPA: EipA family protein, partial [Rhabdaerophilum sp.]|nr:EipA family protein [Rhabdaerophilum sp.]